MKIIFAGTPDVAATTLRALLGSQHQVVAVLTRPDAPVGRKRVITASPVAQLAEQVGLPVIKAKKVSADVVESLRMYQPDLGVIVAYGSLLDTTALDLPHKGWLNLHFSLLPRWRGAAPVQRAILNGDIETGVTIFKLDAGMDTGPILASVPTVIEANESSSDLLVRLGELANSLLLQELPLVEAGLDKYRDQVIGSEEPVAHKLNRAEARISWLLEAPAIERRVKAFNPEPVAYTSLAGEPFRVIDAVALGATDWSALGSESADLHAPGAVRMAGKRVLVEAGSGTLLELKQVQPAGKKVMAALDWARGAGESVRFDLGTDE